MNDNPLYYVLGAVFFGWMALHDKSKGNHFSMWFCAALVAANLLFGVGYFLAELLK